MTRMKPRTCQDCGTSVSYRSTGRCRPCAGRHRVKIKPPRRCTDCGRTITSGSKTGWCKSCSGRRMWVRNREKFVASLRGPRPHLRRHYKDLRWNHFYPRPDGRYRCHYWDGDTVRYIYRSRWVWEQANGPVPEGHDLHHKNHDRSDDRLENLACKPRSQHQREHREAATPEKPYFGAKGPASTMWRGQPMCSIRCASCGKTFELRRGESRRRDRAGKRVRRKYCSRVCAAAAQYHQVAIPCGACGKRFSVRASCQHRKYCSTPCYRLGRRRRVALVCPVCGKEFDVVPCRLRRAAVVTCSMRCAHTYKRVRRARRRPAKA